MPAGAEAIVHEFNRLANGYFGLLADRSTERTEWLQQAEIAIAELYRAALRLPHTEPSNHDAPELLTGDQRRLVTELVDKIGGDSIPYSFVFHPLELNAQPVVGSLADDLASIYQDLYEGRSEEHTSELQSLR